jgi:CheY-like chemotaxis protein
MVRSLLSTVLRRNGFEVLLAAGGQEAIRQLEAHRDGISCVLLDVRMPGLDGPQTLQALRRLEPSLTFCFMSGQPGEYSREQLADLGVASFFDKPFRLDDFVRSVRALVGA